MQSITIRQLSATKVAVENYGDKGAEDLMVFTFRDGADGMMEIVKNFVTNFFTREQIVEPDEELFAGVADDRDIWGEEEYFLD